MFSRATIRLGIGPHSSCVIFSFSSTMPRDWLSVSEMTYFVSSGTITQSTQSIEGSQGKHVAEVVSARC